MSFISFISLLLLPLVSIPLLIHLLNRKNVINVKFSSIRFLKLLESDSIRKLRFIQILLMIIRAIIVLLIILMIARPILVGIYPIKSLDPGSTISAIIIEC